MGRGKSITLKGDAANAFVNAMMGKPSKTEEDKHARIATFIHMEMKADNMSKASLIVKSVCEQGIDKTLDLIEGRS